MKGNLKIFAGNCNRDLAQNICKHVGVKLGQCEIIKFSNDNIKVRILESVRGKDVYIVQSSSPPVNEYIMELLIMTDAIRHAKADSVTAYCRTIRMSAPIRKTSRVSRSPRVSSPTFWKPRGPTAS